MYYIFKDEYATSFLAFGVIAYSVNRLFQIASDRADKNKIDRPNNARLWFRISDVTNFWLYIPLSSFGLVGGAMLLEQSLLSRTTLSLIVSSSSSLFSYLSTMLLIAGDAEVSGPDAALSGMLSGILGLLSSAIACWYFGNNISSAVSYSCSSLTPIVILCLLWSRSTGTTGQREGFFQLIASSVKIVSQFFKAFV